MVVGGRRTHVVSGLDLISTVVFTFALLLIAGGSRTGSVSE